MSGSVLEWVHAIHMNYPYQINDGRENIRETNGEIVLRGGSFDDAENKLTTSYRFGYKYEDSFSPVPGPDQITVYDSLGFRCACDYEP